MPPAKSGLFGPCTIWDLDEDQPDGGNFEWLTSKPYPYELVEAAETSARLESVKYAVVDLLFFSTSMSLSNGVLRTPLQVYEMLPDEYTTSMELDSGELRTILLQYTMQPEEFSTSVDLDVGTLDTVLIRYQNWPAESFETSVDLVGGSLT